MRRTSLLALLLLLPSTASLGELAAQSAHPDSALARVILQQDSLLFAAFNSCDTLALSAFFAPDLEFYHDKTGLTIGRPANVAPIADRCRRIAQGQAPTLLRERLAVADAIYPVPGLGAIQVGRHRFIQGEFHGQPPASATFGFAEVWRYRDSRWQLSRVLSFDH